jgi:hypothetical protein
MGDYVNCCRRHVSISEIYVRWQESEGHDACGYEVNGKDPHSNAGGK